MASRIAYAPSLLATVGLLWSLQACKPVPAGATVVGGLQVNEGNLSSNPELGASAEQARRSLKAALESTGKFVVREVEDGKEAPRVRLEVESARRVSELAEVSVSLELTLPGQHGDWDRLVAEGSARRPAGEGPGAGLDPESRLSAFEGALAGAAGEAATALAWQLEARRKTDAELLRDLTAVDPRLRDYAVRVLAERRNPAAVPHLLARLNDENPVVLLRAVGALVAIGDRRAVRPLIDLTKKRPPQLVAQILYAIGSLGGPEAESFLYTLESGAPEEEVRRAASEAFADLRRKREETAGAPLAPPARPGSP